MQIHYRSEQGIGSLLITYLFDWEILVGGDRRMIRQGEKVAFVAHCIMNQATRARWGGGGASWKKGMIPEVVRLLMRHGVGTVQMDCPEFSLYGNPRPPRSWDGYNTPDFRRRCREIATRACDRMECFLEMGRDPEIGIAAIVGVENSPSCGVELTTRTINGENIGSPGRGHLMEALEAEMRRRGLVVPLIGVSLKGRDREDQMERLEALCTRET